MSDLLQLSPLQWFLVLLGSCMAGIINALAGNGSVITLTLLTEVLGLAPNLANGSNRIGIMMQSMVSGSVYIKRREESLSHYWWLIAAACFGAIGGAWLAITISNASFAIVYKVLLVFMLGLILLKPERWLKENVNTPPLSPWIWVPVMILLGFYGGFIQLGMGLFILAGLVPIAGLNMRTANALKLIIIAAFTGIVIAMFASKNMIHWPFGLLLGAGQALGGWLGSTFGVRYKQANLWAYRVLVVMVVVAVTKAFWP